MYQKSLLFSALIAIVATLDDPRAAKIVDYQSERTSAGHYFFRFESSDGIIREEEGTLLDENDPESPVVVKGSYTYTDSTGKLYTVRYIADENGFHPELPTPVNSPVLISGPRPQLQFIPSTPRPRIRPEVTTPTRIQIPLESTTPKTYNDLDNKLQESIVGLLSNGRGFAVN
ncbi:larval cuticle protein 16/17-like [Tribolium madens]|uniref:larval cuticle protein 16/17-like n=1 Tax=Tribolium madens TaxID=41895 RepID=UPI001CF728BF|nr:larval cuticle protein 16/17-like [Tribolium madens]